jgi:hypothetical protein
MDIVTIITHIITEVKVDAEKATGISIPIVAKMAVDVSLAEAAGEDLTSSTTVYIYDKKLWIP